MAGAGGVWRGSRSTAPPPGPERFGAGEGLVGQAAAERSVRRIRAVPGDYLKVRSGTGERAPVDLVIAPAQSDGRTEAVFELGFLREADAPALQLVERVGETLAVAMRSSDYRLRLQELLEESQRQAEELQTQQEELRVTNEELETQSQELRLAHAQLEERKEELEVMNTSLLGQRSELERAAILIEEKATEVDRASRYKSEFLANMSHELRTPLNSSLILAKLLADEQGREPDDRAGEVRDDDLRRRQRSAALINDILDLSKIEAGKLDVRAREIVAVARSSTTSPTAVRAGGAREEDRLPRPGRGRAPRRTIETDAQRLQQILKNLLSNAIKFTEHGEVSLRSGRAATASPSSCRDTGIGIPPEQHEIDLRGVPAGRRADQPQVRRHGPRPVDLARPRARCSAATSPSTSELGRGSTFTLTLPARATRRRPEAARAPVPAASRGPDRRRERPRARRSPPTARAPSPTIATRVDPGRRLVLVVEDDPAFAKILLDLAHELDFQCLVATTADEGVALALERRAERHRARREAARSLGPLGARSAQARPDDPAHPGARRLGRTTTRRRRSRWAPSATCSSRSSARSWSRRFRRLEDQFSRRLRRVLVVEDDDRAAREHRATCSARPDVEIVAVSTVADGAASSCEARTFDCVVIDLALPDATGLDLLEQMATDERYAFPAGHRLHRPLALDATRSSSSASYSSSIIVKGARSPERLLDEVTLFLHQVESELPADQQRMLQPGPRPRGGLRGAADPRRRGRRAEHLRAHERARAARAPRS